MVRKFWLTEWKSPFTSFYRHDLQYNLVPWCFPSLAGKREFMAQARPGKGGGGLVEYYYTRFFLKPYTFSYSLAENIISSVRIVRPIAQNYFHLHQTFIYAKIHSSTILAKGVTFNSINRQALASFDNY